jgi:hypothetical protein
MWFWVPLLLYQTFHSLTIKLLCRISSFILNLSGNKMNLTYEDNLLNESCVAGNMSDLGKFIQFRVSLFGHPIFQNTVVPIHLQNISCCHQHAFTSGFPDKCKTSAISKNCHCHISTASSSTCPFLLSLVLPFLAMLDSHFQSIISSSLAKLF